MVGLGDMASLSRSALSLSWGVKEQGPAGQEVSTWAHRGHVTGLISVVSQIGRQSALRPNSSFPYLGPEGT